MNNKLELISPGKINLYLDVLSKREDGYHNLEMIMQKIALHDKIFIEKNQGILISCTDKRIPIDSRNIVYKAVELIKADHPQVIGAKIHIEKNIPSQAGLAGGSSNGAAVIKAISQLYDLNLSLEEMCKYGEKLGSDVNFFFYGPTCHVSGKGEIIKEIPPLPPLPVVLIKPKAGLSAGSVYKNLILKDRRDVNELINKANSGDISFILKNLYNKLEESSFALLPELKEIKKDLIKKNPHSLMSGSGTTFFSVFNKIEEAEKFFNDFKYKFNFTKLTFFYH